MKTIDLLYSTLFFSGAGVSLAAFVWCIVMWAKMNKYVTAGFIASAENDKSCPYCGFVNAEKTDFCCKMCGSLLRPSPYLFVYDARQNAVTAGGFILLGGIAAALVLQLNGWTAVYGLPLHTPLVTLYGMPLVLCIVYAGARAADLAKTPDLRRTYSADQKQKMQQTKDSWKNDRTNILRTAALQADPDTFVFALEKMYPADILKKIEFLSALKHDVNGREKCAVLLFNSVKKEISIDGMYEFIKAEPGLPALKIIFTELARKKESLAAFACSGDERTAVCALECIKNLDDLDSVSKNSPFEHVKQAAAEKYEKLKTEQDAKNSLRRLRKEDEKAGIEKAASAMNKTSELRSKVLRIKSMRITKESQRELLDDKLNAAVYLVFDVKSYFDVETAEQLNQGIEHLRAVKDNMTAARVSEYIDESMDMILKYL